MALKIRMPSSGSLMDYLGAVSPGFMFMLPTDAREIESRLINVCLEAGHFPDFIKVAKVTPIFKADDPTRFGNHWPISVLSVIS